MPLLHRNLSHLHADAAVELTAPTGTSVMLLDPDNYERLRRGDGYHGYGGSLTDPAVRLSVPGAGDWHLLVDTGDDPTPVDVRIVR
ncbi:DUF1883 domain-containing protein [Patulibacter sp. S7RM1-6]